MATLARQPFAPIDAARLQTITSLKNRQNGVSSPASTKRKASESVEVDDSENVDPSSCSKRSKGVLSNFGNDIFKPSKFTLTKTLSTPLLPTSQAMSSPACDSPAIVRSRVILNPRSPAAKLSACIHRKEPVFAAPIRAPARGPKRMGLLSSRRRTLGSFSRIDSPLSSASPAPFSLDEAIQGTVPRYMQRQQQGTNVTTPASTPSSLVLESDVKSSWVFDIHEDTPEQEMTNLLQHSTCVLDISSDEESESKLRRERDEGRDKENVPPMDDVSQTSLRRSAVENGMDYEKPRYALGDLNVEEFYEAGCDSTTVVIVPADEEISVTLESEQAEPLKENVILPAKIESLRSVEEALFFDDAQPIEQVEATIDVEALMSRDLPSKEAALLEPIEGTGESFEMWESGSAKDDAELVVAARSRSQTPVPVVFVEEASENAAPVL